MVEGAQPPSYYDLRVVLVQFFCGNMNGKVKEKSNKNGKVKKRSKFEGPLKQQPTNKI